MIYFDNAATTFPKPNEVYEGINYAMKNLSFNAGRGTYTQARNALQVIDELRTEISSLCNSDPNNVSILSSATEALNIIINGLDIKEGINIYVSPFEHNAIIRPLYALKETINFNIFVLPFNKETWEPDFDKIKNLFALNNPYAVFCSQISNVTGLLVNYEELFSISKTFNCVNILDAAQGFGVIGVVKENIDFLVFAGHKSLYGPFGVGGFISFSNHCLKISKSGGTGSDTMNHLMPKSGYSRYESGSFNVPSIYGVCRGIKWLKKQDIEKQEAALTRYLINELAQLENIILYIPEDISKIFGIVSFNIEGYTADEIGKILSEEFDICVRTGFHCAPFVHDFIKSTSIGGTVRISISKFTTKEDLENLIYALKTF